MSTLIKATKLELCRKKQEVEQSTFSEDFSVIISPGLHGTGDSTTSC